MDICTQILIDRRDAKLTQEQVVSEVLGLTRNSLIEIERGRLVPNEQLGKSILKAIQELRTK